METISPELADMAKTAGVSVDSLNRDDGYGKVNIDALNALAKKSKIVSSSSALDTRDAKNAVNAAGSNLTTGNNSLMNTALDNFDAGTSGAKKTYNNTIKTIDIVYDAKLAQQNQQYGQLMSDLKQQRDNAVSVAASNAAALNPYSQAKGAQTADNFTAAINDRFNRQAMNLQAQADAAQQLLAAGQYEAYNNASKAMEEANAKFRSDMMSFMADQRNYNEKVREFNVGQQADELKLKSDMALSLFKTGQLNQDGLNAVLGAEDYSQALELAAKNLKDNSTGIKDTMVVDGKLIGVKNDGTTEVLYDSGNQFTLGTNEIRYDDKGNVIASGPRGETSSKDTITSGGLSTTRSYMGLAASQLDSSRGNDGYVNSDIYKKMASDWQADGGLLKDFLDYFPPETYANPDDASLPSYLKPKKSSGVANPFG